MEQVSRAGKNLIISIILNLFIVIFEIIFGLLIGSMALISDALHNVTDIGSMVLSYGGEKIAARPATKQKTYGYKRIEAIIAFTNAGILLAVITFIIIESLGRLFNPEPVAGLQMLIVAVIALAGNGIATYLLAKDSHNNLNLKSAWLHSLQDAIFSLAVIVGAVGIYYTGWNWLDAALSLLISVFLLKEVLAIIKQALLVMLDSVPSEIDFEQVYKTLEGISKVKKVSDLHIWQLDSKSRLLTVHIKIEEVGNSERNKILAEIQKKLIENFNINHSTIQLVSVGDSDEINLNCNHCN